MKRRDFMTLAVAAAAPALAGCQQGAPDPDPTQSGTPARKPKLQPARKGIGLGVGTKHSLEQLNLLDVSWFYTWDSTFPAVPARTEFVPMIWGREAVRQSAVEKVVSELGVTNAKDLLGFNEPDHPNQAAMSVASAVKEWPRLESSGLRLGSPAPANTLGNWFREFMDQVAAKDLRVDFITMHSYPSPDADAFLNGVQELYDQYSKPIWITEYAVADWEATKRSPSRYSEKQVMGFLRETAAGLREMPFVERYAWMTKERKDPALGPSALFHTDGNLTPLGELYRSL